MTCVLVTGASGFIGRATVAALARKGHAVRAASRRLPDGPSLPGVESVRHPDLSRPVDWGPLLDGIEQVIHLAGIAHTGNAGADVYDQVNRRATAELAAAAAAADVRQFVFVSSIRAQTGPAAGHLLTERDMAAPTDDYGRSKLAAEAEVRAAGVPFTILRPVLLYGPGVKGNFALLLRLADTSWPLPIKNFAGRRSLLGIGNFLSALDFVLATPATIGETYIVADPGIPPRLPDLIATLRAAQGRRPRILPMPQSFAEIPLRLIGRAGLWERIGGDLRADPAKLIAAGWRPADDTRSALAALAQAESRSRKIIPPATPTPNT